MPSATVTTGLPQLRREEARDAGARSLVIGVANSGGFIADTWLPALVEALEAGLHIVSGMHARLADFRCCAKPPTAQAAADRCRASRQRNSDRNRAQTQRQAPADRRHRLRAGQEIYGARHRSRASTSAGIDADFRATGQTGIMIAGRGIPMDAVVADFAAGAAEMLSPAAPDDHWDVIEGQGSLLHPAFAGVSLSLLHGSQPDVIVVCHDPTRERLLGDEDFAVPSVEEIIDLTIRLGSRTNPAIRVGGVSFNTASLGEDEARQLMARSARALGCRSPTRCAAATEFERLIDSCLG